jgi:D-threo-aldose 1-dehydrogenase
MARISLPAVGLGCASLGKPEVPEAEAVGIILAALDAGVGYLDTAALYGCGLSEGRVGRALARWGGKRPALSTKVGYVIDGPEGSYLPPQARKRDYSREGVRSSLMRSLARLGVERVDLAYIHGPDGVPDEAERAFDALTELREEGLVGAIGVGTTMVGTALAVMERCPIDAVLIAGRLTLLDREAEARLLTACAASGVAVVAGGVFNSGILAAPDPAKANFDYLPATSPLTQATRELAAICERFGVPLKVAALKLAGRYEEVTTTLLGAASRAELRECLTGLETPVPEPLWAELDAAMRSHAL